MITLVIYLGCMTAVAALSLACVVYNTYVYMYLYIASTGIFDLKKTKINEEAITNCFETETVFNYLSRNR
jgi:hypothetical protein